MIHNVPVRAQEILKGLLLHGKKERNIKGIPPFSEG